ncbi:cation-translocating P-type ATPase [Mycobacterium sp. PS03-16]|nr:cation-translocating P-type ATPase [Mycobacterium sp. PS03-16]
MVGAAKELVGGQPVRRCWRDDDHCWIEVRGLHADRARELAGAVLDRMTSTPGVRSAQLNVPLSRVVVHVEADGPTLRDLCAAVADVERDHHTDGNAEEVPPTDLPADGMAIAGRALGSAANGVSLCVALAGRALMWPALPTGLTAAVTLVDYQPRLRSLVEHRLGPVAADTALALSAATVYAITQSPTTVAVEFLRHLSQFAESNAAAGAWEQRAGLLAEYADCPEATPHAPRPVPLPPGPIERHAERSGMAQGVAATSVGLLTRNLNLAATAAVVTAPKAARNAREGFCSTLSRGLADRHGVLPLRPSALRMIDRIDAVVVDPRVLSTERLRVGRIRDVADRDRASVWQRAQDQITAGALGAGWHPASTVARNGSGPDRGEVFVRHAHDPLAASVLGQIRRADAEAVSVDLEDLDDLRSSFDELYPVTDSVDDALADAVESLQRDGRTVAVLSAGAARALAGADLAVGVLPADGPPPWDADLLVDDLTGVWRILHAIPAARQVSQRGVDLATASTLLGGLLMIPGVRGRGPGPVTAGAAAGLLSGVRSARDVLRTETPAPAPEQEWHAMSVEQVRDALPTPERTVPKPVSRLSATAKASAGAVGSVSGPVRRTAGELIGAVRQELSDPLTPVLAVGSAASALLGSPVDAVLVGSVLTGNAVLAATQQVRAERLLRRLLARQDPPARLVNGEGFDTVESVRLRPGDVIEVRPGEVVPADARLLNVAELEVDESSLTGESLPVPKQVDATPGAPLAERTCMVYGTTTVVAGTARAVVTTVGAQTQARRAAELPGAQGSAVGLQTQLRELTNRALPFSFAGGGLVTGLSLLRRAPLRQAVSSGVAVAVAAVPEGLPLVATLAQQASARRLTRAGALVRTPRSVEALGRVDVVCFDKTGTLSENRLRVTRVESAGGVADEDILRCAARATPPKNGERHEHATDAAVATAAPEAVLDKDDAVHLPFRSGRPFSATIADRELSLKGAPEVVLAACANLDPGMYDTVYAMAESGLRVIAVARRTVSTAQARKAADDSDAFAGLCGRGLELVGLLGLSDTPREQSAELLETLRRRRIGVRLITGDHPVTATAIAAELGMPVDGGQVISGAEWEALPRRAQETAVREKSVFARMSPEHKVQIVQTLERTGQICAMVGDGANDAAAIRAATVGIGVASHGSDPARTAADVMLLEGRIGALADALDEGRQLWRRVQAAVSVLLGGNAGEVAFAIVGTALTGRSPLNTRQLLLVNMMTDALPAAALAVSPSNGAEGDAGHGPDRAALWRTVAIRGTTTAAAATVAWFLGGSVVGSRRASTVALVALVSTQLGQTLIDSHSPLVVATALGSLTTLGVLISIPGVSHLLGCTPLDPLGWAQALGTAGVATAAAAIAPQMIERLPFGIRIGADGAEEGNSHGW